MRAYDAAAFVLLVVPALLVILSFLPWALHREAGMCDQELHRGKYVCVHDVPCALDTASATTEFLAFSTQTFRQKILACSTQTILCFMAFVWWSLCFARVALQLDGLPFDVHGTST